MTAWDRGAYEARISSTSERRRHEAASPDPVEVASYLRGLGPAAAPGRTVVVLGATPELRVAIAETGASVIAVDQSADAWEIYGDWGPTSGETRVHGSWFDLPDHVEGSVDGVVGDGIIGNLADLEDALRLLEIVRSVLDPAGACVLRQALVPSDAEPADVTADELLAQYRRGQLDLAEFAFGVRLLGHLTCCWDHDTGHLDGAAQWSETERWMHEVSLDDEQQAALRRYAYRGTNLIPSADAWESAVVAAGFAPPHPLGTVDRHWRWYYPVQRLSPAGDR